MFFRTVFAVSLTFCFVFALDAQAKVSPEKLRCEYRTEPLGIDVQKPRLSWILTSKQRSQTQTACQILVATNPSLLNERDVDLWNSGFLLSGQNTHVPYGGTELTSRQKCYWKVRVWDQSGRPSSWSAFASWTMGILKDSDWNGDWIGAPEPLTAGSASEDNSHSAPALLLRKEFSLEQRPVSALVNLCGLGYYELYVNGKKIGDRVLEPGFTDYNKRVLYATYQIAGNLREGTNTLGVILGGGWYHVATPELFGFEKAPWRAPMKLLFDLDATFPDGGRKNIYSDSSWKWSTGPITFNCIRGGETYDAREEKPGWDSCQGYDASGWQSAQVMPPPSGRLQAQAQPPIRVTQSIKPVSINEPKPGVYVFDLGVNIAGWVSLNTKGDRDQKITLEFNEKLNPDGTACMQHTHSHTYGRFQTGELILKGQGIETYEPRFTYHGFQYVQVTGLTEKPTLDTLTGKWVHTDPESVGTFSCSNDYINSIHEIIRRTQLNNIHSIPTDCPQREKMGWMHDGCVTMEEAMFNFDMAAFYIKWSRDMLDSQQENGHVPPIVPTCGWGKTGADNAPSALSDPWWGGAIILAPWRVYQFTGDTQILEEAYAGMKAYVAYMGTTAKDGILYWNLGDWLEVKCGGVACRTPVAQTSTAGYFYLTKTVAKVAETLGKQEEAAQYKALADEIQKKFNGKFLNAETGLYAEDSQSAQAVALYVGIVPESTKELVFGQLVKNFEGVREGHLSTGLVGTLPLFKTLNDFGRPDLAYRAVTQEDFPGYLWMIKNGATTLWEAWEDFASRNHPALGSMGCWFYESLAGIRCDPASPGFMKIIVRPEPVGDLRWAKARYDSIQGPIVCEWEKGDKFFTLNLEIPANTTARVFLPADAKEKVFESGKPTMKAEGVRYLWKQGDRLVYEVGSGTFLFQVRG